MRRTRQAANTPHTPHQHTTPHTPHGREEK
nr:MAG TPA: hypothetical protein [Caudoviricetes sp.]